MKFIDTNIFKKKSIDEYGFLLFLFGIFFLPSTLFIGILFLIPAAIIGSFLKKEISYLNDKWNYPFLLFGFLIIISAFSQNFILSNKYPDIWDPILSIYGLANWIPLIWFFWAFQSYLDSKRKRRLFGLVLLSGTFPVLITGFGQYFLNWTGPFETLNGLIIWFQRPIENPGGLTGLFNNQNYAGSWLNFVWPFCIAIFLDHRKDIFRKTIALSFLFSVAIAAFLTYSRNAWIGLLTSLPIILGKKEIKYLLLISTIVTFLLFFLLLPFFKGETQINLRSFLPSKILLEFSEEGYKELDVTRFEIFLSAIKLIKISPILGIGAASFSSIFFYETNFWKGHSHNLLLELSISYGLPATIIFFITITLIILLSGKKIFLKNKLIDDSYFDKAFWAALFFFLISQLADIQYFDGKISIVAWIFIAGLKNIIDEKNPIPKTN